MEGKRKWALLVSIQGQIKSPLSRSCSRGLFHLCREHWPPIAMSPVFLLSCTNRSFQTRKREAAFCLQHPPNQPSYSHRGLFKISLPGLCIPVRQSHVLSALGHRKRSQSRPFSGHRAASLWTVVTLEPKGLPFNGRYSIFSVWCMQVPRPALSLILN